MRLTYIGDHLPVPGTTRRRQPSELLGIAVHRFGGWDGGLFVYPATAAECRRLHIPWKPELVGESWGDNPFETARFFREIYGWRHPYTLQVYRGELVQTAPLDVITPHAGAFNRTHLAVLITGDHRLERPPEEDLEVAAAACAALCLPRRWHPSARVTLHGHDVPRVLGHDELPAGATATPGKTCPGAGLDLPIFRDRVADHLSRLRDETLAGAGFVLTAH